MISENNAIKNYNNSHNIEILNEKKYNELKEKINKQRNLMKKNKSKINIESLKFDNYDNNKLYRIYMNNIYHNKEKLNVKKNNINLSWNFEDEKLLLNNNKSSDCVMPPNNLNEIIRKNLIFNKLISKNI